VEVRHQYNPTPATSKINIAMIPTFVFQENINQNAEPKEAAQVLSHDGATGVSFHRETVSHVALTGRLSSFMLFH
jgi:hypothetical protein